MTLQYAGSKALPPRVHLDGGFPVYDRPPACFGRERKGAMHTFTREFRHPEDRMASVSAAAAERFLCDGKRFPPGAYEANSLVWKGPTGERCPPVRELRSWGTSRVFGACSRGP